MGLSRLENLYRQVILDHSAHPRNYGRLEHASETIELNNPTCGDVITLQLQLEEGVIKAAKFFGHGCSISTASASLMTETVIGKTTQEALDLAQDFFLLVQAKKEAGRTGLGEAAVLGGVAKFPARIKCATLSWKALERAVLTEEKNSRLDLEEEENTDE